MVKCDKVRIIIRDYNYNNHRVTNTTNCMHIGEKTERLGLWCVGNIGPRGSKGKLLKLKRN